MTDNQHTHMSWWVRRRDERKRRKKHTRESFSIEFNCSEEMSLFKNLCPIICFVLPFEVCVCDCVCAVIPFISLLLYFFYILITIFVVHWLSLLSVPLLFQFLFFYLSFVASFICKRWIAHLDCKIDLKLEWFVKYSICISFTQNMFRHGIK